MMRKYVFYIYYLYFRVYQSRQYILSVRLNASPPGMDADEMFV